MNSYKDQNFPRAFVSVNCKTDSDEEFARNSANLFVDPVIAATRVICAAEDKAGLAKVLDVPSLTEALKNLTEALNHNDQSGIENALLSQATALQALFVRLTERAMQTKNDQLSQSFLKLALRAQSQSKSSFEALLDMRRPPAIHAQLANLASTQQITLNPTFLQNQLSGEMHELPENSRASGVEGEIGAAMETLGKIHRPQNFRG